MKICLSVRRRSGFQSPLVLLLILYGVAQGAEQKNSVTTLEEARNVLDLEVFPLLPKAETPSQRNLAELTYLVASDVTSAYSFQRVELVTHGWHELSGGGVTPQYATGNFSKNNFIVSVDVLPQGKKVMVSLIQRGNVDLKKLPLPEGVKPLIESPTSLTGTAENSPVETQIECEERLKTAGWMPYGGDGDTRYYKQNAVRLGLKAFSEPAQGGKTLVQLQSILMPVNLPAPPEFGELQYMQTGSLAGDSALSLDEIKEFYHQELIKQGWKQILSRESNLANKKIVITYQHPKKDLMTLNLLSRDKRTSFHLEYTAFGAAATKVDEEKMADSKTIIQLTLPDGAGNIQKTSQSEITFALNSGSAKSTIDRWLIAFPRKGWKVSRSLNEKNAGMISLAKGKVRFSVDYVDIPGIPASVRLEADGGEFQIVKPMDR